MFVIGSGFYDLLGFKVSMASNSCLLSFTFFLRSFIFGLVILGFPFFVSLHLALFRLCCLFLPRAPEAGVEGQL